MTAELAMVNPMDDDSRGRLIPAEQRQILKNAAALARDVARIVKENGLSKRFGQSAREHVFVEGWLTISRVNNEQPHAEVKGVLKDPESGHEVIHARAWLTDADGKTVSEADGYCSSEEGNWAGKPFYARASMAQTRAVAKAMRLRHAWVMVMAGFAPTPAEEMSEEILEAKATVKPVAPQPVKKAAPPPEPVVVPETEAAKSPSEMGLERVTIIGYAKEPKTGKKSNGQEWWKIGVKVRMATGEEAWVNCWSKNKFELMKSNKGRDVLLTYSRSEYNGTPQLNVEDVQEIQNG